MIQLSPEILADLHRNNIQVRSSSGPFTISRPDQASMALETDQGPLVIKVFTPGKGQDTFDDMTRLWQSSFGARRSPPGLPRPLAFFEGSSVLVMERLDGHPMVKQMESGLDRLEEIARTLADLHSSNAAPGRVRDARRVARSIERKLTDLAGTCSEQSFARLARRLSERLPEAAARPVALVPTHGDFSPRNVLLTPDRVAFIDWDRFQQADPARDLAYFGAWCWVMDLRAGLAPDWRTGDRFVEEYLSYRAVAGLENRLGFYRAAALARIAHSQVRLWKSEEWVSAIVDEALRWLA